MAGGIAGTIAATLILLAAPNVLAAPAAEPQEPPPREFYGVVSQGKLDSRDFQRMGTGRVGTVRVLLDWSEIDPTPLPNDYAWSRFDATVSGAARHGVDVLPTLYSVPRWVSMLERCEGPVYGPCKITPPTTDVGLSAWNSFVAAAVSRYGSGGSFWTLHPELPRHPIEVWQIWNEQNSPGFYQPRPDVADYAQLLDRAADAIRDEDPQADVLLGGMFRYPLRGAKGAIRATDYLARLYQRPGIEADFDGVAVHPYAAKLSGVQRAIARTLKIVAEAGDLGTGLWITEVGWASGGKPNPLNRGLSGQAARLTQAFSWLSANRAALGLRLVAWFAWRDLPLAGSRCAWCARSGLFREGGLLAKPSWERFMQFTGGS